MSRIDRDLLASRYQILPIRYTAVLYRRSIRDDSVISSEAIADVSVKKRSRTEVPSWQSTDMTQTVALVRTREIRLPKDRMGEWEPREQDIIHLVDMAVGNSGPTSVDEWWCVQSVDTKNADSRFVCQCNKTEKLET